MANQIKLAVAISMFAIALNVSAAQGASAITDCAGITDIKSKSRESSAASTLMVSLLTIEKQGEADFRPKYAAPASECVFQKFEVAGVSVSAIYTPFAKGESTLHYRFAAAGSDEPREIIVVYDALASLVAKKGEIFFVIENRKGSISYYAMYRDQPTYAVLKPVVVSILDGTAKPLATVHWPAGAKEPVIDAFDSKRLK
jgi:hypothetical protein